MPPASPQSQIMGMLSGYWISQCVYAAAKLSLADRLVSGPKSADQLARETSTHPRSLYRFLRTLASLGIFAEDGEKKFRLTPLAECLREDGPGSMRAVALMIGDEHYRAWGEFLYSLRTGKPAFDHVYGMPIFDYLSLHPDKGAIFDRSMTGIHGRETAAMLSAYDFGGIGTLMDVGGGNGSLLAAVLGKYPTLRGVLYDLPPVVARAKAHLDAAGLAGRYEGKGGSFFESVPSGADAILMRHIIHDWDDERSAVILKHCHAALPPQGRLLLVESVIPPGNEPMFGKLLDLNMLVIPGGVERTEAEYRDLYQSAGFTLTRIVATESEVNVIEGRKG